MMVDNLNQELDEYRLRLEEIVDERTSQLQIAMRRIQQTYDETLEALASAVDLRNDETAGHSRRVTLYALEIAKVMMCPREACRQLARGALLHDVGKIAIPDSILLKPGKLTPPEMGVMKTHVLAGHSLVSRIAFLAPAAQIVLTHHERFDGAGYPHGLAANEIPLGARIFAVVDALDAITSDRPYRRGRPFATAREVIAAEAAKQFDPEVVKAFFEIGEETWNKARHDADIALPLFEQLSLPLHHDAEDSTGVSFGHPEDYQVLANSDGY